MRFPRTWILAVAWLAGFSPGAAAEIPSLAQRAEWFRNDRFGLFIHWGVYALIGKGEWVRDTGKIPLEQYDELPARFHPVKFNAAEWVSAAKRAGMKYLVITTKHHDGFCMFDSKLTDYDIMSTPLRRDVIKEIADECHRQGLRLGFYYSIMDWHHPDYLPRRPWEKARSTEGANFDRYVEYMRGQLRELLTNYGRVDVLWFDGGWERTSADDLKKFQAIIAEARQLQPHLLVNNRAKIGGDYETPEQFVPATGVTDKEGRPALWEACMTMTTGHGAFAPTAWWGYDRYETVFKPSDELVQKLIDIASKGGNFLLNIGPTPEGTIRPEEAERMAAIGRWMDRYGESIYGTSPSPFRLLPFFGRVTVDGSRLYVHVFDWPEDSRLVLPKLKTKVRSAAVFGCPDSKVSVDRRENDLVLSLPTESLSQNQGRKSSEPLAFYGLGKDSRASDTPASVLVIELAGPPQVEPVHIAQAADGSVSLPAVYAEIQAQHGQRAKPLSKAGRTYIGNWSNAQDIVVWHFELSQGGRYRVTLDARPASDDALGQRVEIGAGKEKITGKIAAGGVELADELRLPAGKVTLSVKLPQAKRTGPAVLDLYSVKLVPTTESPVRQKSP